MEQRQQREAQRQRVRHAVDNNIPEFKSAAYRAGEALGKKLVEQMRSQWERGAADRSQSYRNDYDRYKDHNKENGRKMVMMQWVKKWEMRGPTHIDQMK